MLFLFAWLIGTIPLLGCEVYIEQSSQEHAIPPQLLRAISLVESGRTVNRQKIAWPWTVQAEGEGRMFATKQEAILAVKQLQQKGQESIDVGCMQINLKHHPHAFQNLDEAFDPQKNVGYAAHFLKKLHQKWQRWTHAVAHYHSANAAGLSYQKRVYQNWLHPHSGVIPDALDGQAPEQIYTPFVRVTKRYISLTSDAPPHTVVTTRRFIPLSRD